MKLIALIEGHSTFNLVAISRGHQIKTLTPGIHNKNDDEQQIVSAF